MKGDESAFPVELEVQMNGVTHHRISSPGLSKRELLAGMALQGILASRVDVPSSTIYKMDKEWTASEAVQYADALLRELAGEGVKA